MFAETGEVGTNIIFVYRDTLNVDRDLTRMADTGRQRVKSYLLLREVNPSIVTVIYNIVI